MEGAALHGAEGIRTPDLISAIDARSQLRYSPIWLQSILENEAVVKCRNPVYTAGGGEGRTRHHLGPCSRVPGHDWLGISHSCFIRCQAHGLLAVAR